MATIKAIEGQSIHQIQSGQVIVDLNSVVKELVENSLDAGATSIDVRFKNQGLDSIEVQDNGRGISPDDYETVALKHHTSKLSSYEDLTTLDTFGFRGEALSSLCALSKFHIITARSEDGAVGKRLDFEVSGKLKAASVTAAPKGTTVAVENLFCNLPVRRKELERNIKREYGKVVGLLYAYACISVGVRFSVSNQMPKGKKVPVFSTKSNTTTKENIVNVFGAKTLIGLLGLDLRLEMAPSQGPPTQTARNWSAQATDRSAEVRVQGHISKPIFGEGRQAPDRQMFFVNSRPCALPQVSKAVNEVYKSFNVTQSPFIFANLIMDTQAYDVNVSPDKRTIMLHDQTALLESLKKALTELFEKTDHTVPQSTLPNKKLPAFHPLSLLKRSSTDSATVEQEQDEAAPEERGGESQRYDTQVPGSTPTAAEHIAKLMHQRRSGSLIDDWVGRDAEPRQSTLALKKTSTGLSIDKQRPVRAMQDPAMQDGTSTNGHSFDRENESSPAYARSEVIGEEWKGRDEAAVHGAVNDVPQLDEAVEARRVEGGSSAAEQPLGGTNEPDPTSTSYDDLFSQRPSNLQKAPEQRTAAAATMQTGLADNNASVTDPVESEARLVQLSHEHEREPPIAAVALSSQSASPGPIANAFDRMRPKRTPLQTAEITVGDKTTTTIVGSGSAVFNGSPAYKRRRIHDPANSQAIAKFGASPLLARGLKNFAAPGSQMHMEGDSSDLPALAAHSSDGNEDDSDDDSASAQIDTPEEPAMADADQTPTSDIGAPTTDPRDALMPAPVDDDAYDEDYVDERQKRIQEDEKVARLIQEAEESAARPSGDLIKRASQMLRNGGNRKDATLQLMLTLETSVDDIHKKATTLQGEMPAHARKRESSADDQTLAVKDELNATQAESKLSLTVSKSDFERMIVVGQFNLGFILAIRPATNQQEQDELFIIDQHAADEKYNYERLQRTVTLQSQRMVRPQTLELTAIEEEIMLNNVEALMANGFEVETTSHDTSTESASRHIRLLTLPISGEKTFDLSDLEELLHLLSEQPAGSKDIPRPKKVQRMLAMRACRRSIMVGKTLTAQQMRKVVSHMGEMEKPWNCPHGRPTMRHLAGLGAWSDWREGEVVDGEGAMSLNVDGDGRTDWKRWLEGRK
ncbi:DNA mismatch repair protein pms1 [Teratosphaeria destructans]|uniref:DNA mismatch repair protein PMS1 n=1 Tax=Teratosphaeria destructans TaxID=418781 RepID=A0A9W7VY65_9PEZI|nr:DNA mismatch repair protein pms1 [Teratosphaeria destructans]